MATYARLQNGIVAELFTTTVNIDGLFPPSLIWLDVTDVPQAAVGWTAQGSVVIPPARAPQPPPMVHAPPSALTSLATVQAQLTMLQAQLDHLATSSRSAS